MRIHTPNLELQEVNTIQGQIVRVQVLRLSVFGKLMVKLKDQSFDVSKTLEPFGSLDIVSHKYTGRLRA